MKSLKRRQTLLLLALLVSVFLPGVIFTRLQPAGAAPGIYKTINFQGKITNPNGTNVTDGSYQFVFALYTVSSGGTATWTETVNLSVDDGIFQHNLGSSTALPGSVNFNTDNIYLGITFNSDPAGEMSPRIRFTASPYAFNADQLDGLDASAFVQLSPGSQQTGNINVSGSGTFGNGLTVSSGGAGITGNLSLGTASASNGVIVYNNSTNGNTVTLQTGVTASTYVLTLPTTGPGVDQCLRSNGTTASQLEFGTCTATGSVTLQQAYNTSASPAVITTTAAKTISVEAGAAPTADMFSISNAGQAVATAGVEALSINYVGGSGAIESAGMRIDFAPGGTSGSTWSGLRIVANATGAASGVTEYGIKLEGPGTPGAGTETGIKLTTGWDIGLDIASGGIVLGDQSEPAAPAAGNLHIYAKSLAGRMLLRQKGPSGVATPLQPSLFQNNIAVINAQSGANVNLFGTGSTLDGGTRTTVSSETIGYMTNVPTAATAGDDAGIGTANTMFYRGSTSGANGFFFSCRAAYPDASYSSARTTVGMTDRTIAQMGGGDDVAGHRATFTYSTARGDTNWQFSTKDGTTQNLVNTGMAFAASKVYDFYVYVTPQGTTIYWRIDNLTDNTSQEGSVTSNLPGGSTGLRGALTLETIDATVRNIRMQRMYIESDR